MLILNQRLVRKLNMLDNLNTSYVDIKLILWSLNILNYMHLNTSYVDIKL